MCLGYLNLFDFRFSVLCDNFVAFIVHVYPLQNSKATHYPILNGVLKSYTMLSVALYQRHVPLPFGLWLDALQFECQGGHLFEFARATLFALHIRKGGQYSWSQEL